MKVFLAHPFEGKAKNRLRASWLTEWYREQWGNEGKTGWEIINMVDELRGTDCRGTELLLKARDILYKCDILLIAPGWTDSHSCIYIHDAAVASQMMIFHIPSELYKGGVAA